jgi:hypothetical protein
VSTGPADEDKVEIRVANDFVLNKEQIAVINKSLKPDDRCFPAVVTVAISSEKIRKAVHGLMREDGKNGKN